MTRARNANRLASYWHANQPARVVGPEPEVPAGAPNTAEPTAPDALRWGYTLRDLDLLTRAALKADRLLAMDYASRRDIAWSAIAEHLYTTEEAPTRQELVRIGWQAIYTHVRDGQRQRGYREGYNDYATTDPTMPRFVQYWGPGVTPSHEDRIVDRVATRQVMAALTNPVYRDAILALAACDNYVTAAQALNLNYSTLTVRLTVARRQFLARWHEHETPHRPRRTDRRVEVHGKTLADRCGRGHKWTPENTRTRHRTVRGTTKQERVCRACEAERGAARPRGGGAT